KVEFRSVFRAQSQKFKILAIPNVLAHRKSYEYGFTKKHDGHKICTKLRAKSSFNRFFMHHLKFKILTIPNILAPSRKFKILAIPNILAHEKSYEHGFTKKYDVINIMTSHTRSGVSIGFSYTISKIQNTGHSKRISP
ncbi:hypothetical protein BHM03_00057332, partial [Ensete ventricosum]